MLFWIIFYGVGALLLANELIRLKRPYALYIFFQQVALMNFVGLILLMIELPIYNFRTGQVVDSNTAFGLVPVLVFSCFLFLFLAHIFKPKV